MLLEICRNLTDSSRLRLSAVLLDVVVRQGAAVLQLFSGKNQTLPWGITRSKRGIPASGQLQPSNWSGGIPSLSWILACQKMHRLKLILSIIMRPWPNSDIRALSFLSSSPIWAAAAASWGLEGSSLPYLVRIGILQVHTPYKTTKHVSLHVVDGIRGLSRTTCSEEEKKRTCHLPAGIGNPICRWCDNKPIGCCWTVGCYQCAIEFAIGFLRVGNFMISPGAHLHIQGDRLSR